MHVTVMLFVHDCGVNVYVPAFVYHVTSGAPLSLVISLSLFFVYNCALLLPSRAE